MSVPGTEIYERASRPSVARESNGRIRPIWSISLFVVCGGRGELIWIMGRD